MKEIFRLILKFSRRLYGIIIRTKQDMHTDFEGQNASDEIKNMIESKKPFMIARFGAVELRAMVASKYSNLGFKKYLKYIKGEIPDYELRDYIINTAHINAGIFPPSHSIISKFGSLMENDKKDLDLLGVWLNYENTIIGSNIPKIPMKDIEPYYHRYPWTKALENKKVLVIHPFTDSIKKQYERRSLLFDNRDILPNFTLVLIKAVQTAAGEKSDAFKTWFDALEYMKNEIDSSDFDIAIIGCGAYGFSLAAHIKRMGKQAIHMGGATQILFGIKGKRWEKHKFISKLYNDNWIRPSELETPRSSASVEDSCYW